VACFDLEDKPFITFTEFVVHMNTFNSTGRVEQKTKVAFRLHDFDDDGKLSKGDLVRYLRCVSVVQEGVVDYEDVAEEILKEASTEEDDHRFLSYEVRRRAW